MNTNLRQSSTVTDAEWQALEEVGYVRLGVVASEAQIDELCERIDQIMLGDIRYEGMQMQLCPSASDDREKVDFSQNHKGSSLKYRKIQELEMDPLFLDYIQNPLFRDITRNKIGDRVIVFRAMFFNKPADGGISKNWHQDARWNLSVPEEIAVYTALDPQTRENGCLMVIPHSHKECPFESVNTDEKTHKYAPPERRFFMEMEKGEVVLFKNKLLHSSLVNTTNRPRRAFSIAFVHADTYEMTSGKRFPQVMPEYRPAAHA